MHVDGGATGNTSAAQKGESLEDTIRCLECYVDAIVLRHPMTGSVGRVIGMCQKPILNAGDGVGEHPTQALLDAFTIYDELKLANGGEAVPECLTVVLLGDLKHGRTVHSLAQLLAATTRHLLWRNRLILRCCAPPGLQLPEAVRDQCAAVEGVTIEIMDEGHAHDAVRNNNNGDSDTPVQVLYVTRIQRERFATEADYNAVKVSDCRKKARRFIATYYIARYVPAFHKTCAPHLTMDLSYFCTLTKGFVRGGCQFYETGTGGYDRTPSIASRR
jgi:aspartate carbamoyltransferase catalytic subunit